MTDPTRRVEPAAIASLATAVVGAIAWPFLGGFVAMVAATIAFVFGLLALHRIKRNGNNGRWLAIVGIGLGAAFYLFFIVTIARDIIDPVQLKR
jgi:Domain of unknown function (DUF4190)